MGGTTEAVKGTIVKNLAVVLFLLSTSALAQGLIKWISTGNDLIALCKDGDAEPGDVTTLMHGANCAGFMLGVVESHPKLCVPLGVTQTQMKKIVYSYADKNPKYLNLLAKFIVYSAIADGFGTGRKGTVCK